MRSTQMSEEALDWMMRTTLPLNGSGPIIPPIDDDSKCESTANGIKLDILFFILPILTFYVTL